MFPMIGEFGGVEQQGDGSDRLEIDSKFNVRYIAADPVVVTRTIHDINNKGQPLATQMVDGQYDGGQDGVGIDETPGNKNKFEEPKVEETKDTNTDYRCPDYANSSSPATMLRPEKKLCGTS